RRADAGGRCAGTAGHVGREARGGPAGDHRPGEAGGAEGVRVRHGGVSGILGGCVQGSRTPLGSLWQADDAAPRCIAARILAHPDPERVGDFAPLFDAQSSGAVALNRLAPDFRAPDGAGSGPLRSRRITRSPLHVLRQGDGLQLRYDATAPPVEVNGEALRGTRTIDAGELATGLVILFGRDLALWL